jgi:D-arabinose 1-dehydrogenase-like Zn-dependent alcohol dehydrogenase
MKALRYYRYGPPDVLELADIDVPAVGDDELLVRVRAASVNPLDWHFMRGSPYLVRMIAGLSRPRPSATKLGADMAGSVEAVGNNVTGFRPGDEVFGGLADRGTLAEYLTMRHDGAMLTKPAGLSFEQAAAVPVAGFTALQALRDKGKVQRGQKVLVNGAAGGVGTFAVQLAKAFGHPGHRPDLPADPGRRGHRLSGTRARPGKGCPHHLTPALKSPPPPRLAVFRVVTAAMLAGHPDAARNLRITGRSGWRRATT